VLDILYAKAPSKVLQRAVHIHPTVSEFIPTMLDDLAPVPDRAAWQPAAPNELTRLSRLRQLSTRGSLLGPLTSESSEFGDVVAALIVLIGLISFASAGLWVSP